MHGLGGPTARCLGTVTGWATGPGALPSRYFVVHCKTTRRPGRPSPALSPFSLHRTALPAVQFDSGVWVLLRRLLPRVLLVALPPSVTA